METVQGDGPPLRIGTVRGNGSEAYLAAIVFREDEGLRVFRDRNDDFPRIQEARAPKNWKFL